MGRNGLQCDRGITLLSAGFFFLLYDLAMLQVFRNRLFSFKILCFQRTNTRFTPFALKSVLEVH